ncbi:MAG: DUF1360 domain-containing protein [Bacteroidales bacterium]|nr:DUF1360 domain-containing protein [Bacteroidales bacterium]
MEKTPSTPNSQQQSWNFWATLFFIVCFLGLGFALEHNGISIEDFTIGNIALMTLATYRLTRILVFDKIFKLFRDFFRSRQRLYVFYVIKEIITCPWCAGVWVAMVIIGFYFLVPFGKLFIVLLSISGVASFIVILVNYLGLSTEEKQYDTREKTKDSDYTKLS